MPSAGRGRPACASGAWARIGFRGLREPQAVFQVEAADLPARFPPLRTLAAPDGETDDRPSAKQRAKRVARRAPDQAGQK